VTLGAGFSMLGPGLRLALVRHRDVEDGEGRVEGLPRAGRTAVADSRVKKSESSSLVMGTFTCASSSLVMSGASVIFIAEFTLDFFFMFTCRLPKAQRLEPIPLSGEQQKGRRTLASRGIPPHIDATR
jgi:hypothetical protein